MQIAAGTVVALRDARVQPRNKLKWHICVCPDRRLFLRINSKPIWRPWHFIEARNNPFLAHDSYVELTTLHFFPESELRGARKIGEMPPAQQVELAFAAKQAATLNDEQKDIIFEKLGS